MSKNKLIFLTSFVIFAGLTVYALWIEVDRGTAQLKSSISGVILTAPGVGGGIIKTDNAHVLLFDPETLDLVASKIINPFLPPLTFSIGQDDAGKTLSGHYRLLVLTDKNGNPNRPSSGEVIGPLSPPILLGTEGFEYSVDRPFQNYPEELLSAKMDTPATSISGTITVAPDKQGQLSPTDSLVIMLFDPKQGRPVAIKMFEDFNPPQKFSIGQANAMSGQTLNGKYSLRILTDKNNQPFQSVPGEIIGRSNSLLSMGTADVKFVLDQSYTR